MTGDPSTPHRRRARYAGKYPRRFDEKYKELHPEQYPETVRKVLDSGKTPAGAHVPILTAEILEALDPQPGEVAVDCTLGYGGHARAMLQRIQPGGKLLGLDVDPLELPKTEARMRRLGFGPDVFVARGGEVFRAASSTVTPPYNVQRGSATASSSRSTTSVWSASIARARARGVIVAPFRSSTTTGVVWPSAAALSSAVVPAASTPVRSLTRAPRATI